MSQPIVPAWKEAPFLRLLPPFIAGILLQWYLMPALPWPAAILTAAALPLAFIQTRPIAVRFKLRTLQAICINLLLLAAGMLITYFNHPANRQNWLPLHYTGKENIKAVLQEPPVHKARSYKAIVAARQVYSNGRLVPVSGNIIVYFSRGVKVTDLSYGSIIIINKPLTPVKSSGNPGAFNYQRHCTFSKIAYQAYLQPKDFVVMPGSETRGLQRLIFTCRQQVLNTLAKFIKGPKEQALAEALLIGYKGDLDKDLVQAYSNTGVIHIIAVSGMHLGIIYLLLSRLVEPFRKNRTARCTSAVVMLIILWGFSLLAGAGPSVVRSAVMFSLMIIGDTFSKRSSVYNNLAASAFLLLCWNPFWLWDAGFQLSYAAVLSIVLFFRPVYNLMFVQNKLLDGIWKLNAVTLSAQVLTLPFTIYHFHQFPNLFLLANLVAVPLSSILLIAEIILCCVSFTPLLAAPIGAAINFLIHFMNDYIDRINSLPFSSWTHLYINTPQAILLMLIICAVAMWFMLRSKHAFIAALSCVALFMMFRGWSFATAAAQRKLIIYNMAKTQAIDLIEGRQYYFSGDAAAQTDPMLRNFHLEPSRTMHRVAEASALPGLLGKGPLFRFNGSNIMIIDNSTPAHLHVPNLQLLVVSKNAPVTLLQHLNAACVVADGSNSAWNTTQWHQACSTLNIPFHNVTQHGAFIKDLP
jgi:competence protein ComEC